MGFAIVMDSAGDVPPETLRNPRFFISPCIIIREDGTEHIDDGNISIETIFDWQKKGEVVRTSQPPPAHFYEAISSALSVEKRVLVLTISKGVSGTYQSAKIAADMFDKDEVFVYDTRGLSILTGLAAIVSLQLMEKGFSIEETVSILNRLRDTENTFALFDSLHYLRKSGRINWSKEYFGTIMRAKPMLEFTTDGVFKPYKNVLGGRKKALNELVMVLKNRAEKWGEARKILLAADFNTKDDLEYVVEKIKSNVDLDSTFVGRLGSVLAGHGGPGVLAAAIGVLPPEIDRINMFFR